MSTQALTTATTPHTTTPHTTIPTAGERIMRVVRLQLVDKKQLVLVPLLIIVSGIIISIIIGELIKLAGASPEAVTEGMRNNQAALWILTGYFVSLGALMYAKSLPFAVALGATRRDYWLGTTLTLVITSVALAVLSTLLMFVERATNGWFTGARMYDTYILGNGDALNTFLMAFVISGLSLLAGNFFAAIYLRWKSAGVTFSIIGIVAIILGLIALAVAAKIDVFGWMSTDPYLKIAAIVAVIMVLMSATTWVIVRNAPVGR